MTGNLGRRGGGSTAGGGGARPAGAIVLILVLLGWPGVVQAGKLSWLDDVSDLATMMLGGSGTGVEYDPWIRTLALALPALAGFGVVAWRVRRAEEGLA